MILMHIYNEILYVLVDWYCSKYRVMGIYMIPHTLEYWATIAHDHNYDLIMMSYINSWSCYENPQDSSYNLYLYSPYTWKVCTIFLSAFFLDMESVYYISLPSPCTCQVCLYFSPFSWYLGSMLYIYLYYPSNWYISVYCTYFLLTLLTPWNCVLYLFPHLYYSIPGKDVLTFSPLSSHLKKGVQYFSSFSWDEKHVLLYICIIFLSTLLTPGKCVLYSTPLFLHLKVCSAFLSTLLTPGMCVLYFTPLARTSKKCALCFSLPRWTWKACSIFLSACLTTKKCRLYLSPLSLQLGSVNYIPLHLPHIWKECTVFLSTLLTTGECVLYFSPLSLHLESTYCIPLHSPFTWKIHSVLFNTFHILGKCELYLSLFFLYLGGVYCIPLHSPYTWEVCTAFISTCLTVHLDSVLYFYPFSLYL